MTPATPSTPAPQSLEKPENLEASRAALRRAVERLERRQSNAVSVEALLSKMREPAAPQNGEALPTPAARAWSEQKNRLAQTLGRWQRQIAEQERFILDQAAVIKELENRLGQADEMLAQAAAKERSLAQREEELAAQARELFDLIGQYETTLPEAAAPPPPTRKPLQRLVSASN